jgi:maltooligosyltrehalose trehalohydrolase
MTTEQSGYYADFGSLKHIKKALSNSYVYDGNYSVHRERSHGRSAVGLAGDHFVVCSQNHDQVGNRGLGERLVSLLNLEQQKIVALLTFVNPFIPLVFMGEEYGENNPFLYFVDHSEEALREAVRLGRKLEFESFDWAENVPDPSAVETYTQSAIDLEKRLKSPHRKIHSLYKDLISIKRRESALKPGGAISNITCCKDEKTFAFVLESRDSESACALLVNFAAEPRAVAHPFSSGTWTVLLDTTSAQYGAGVNPAEKSEFASTSPNNVLGGTADTTTLPATSAILYQRTSHTGGNSGG